MEMGRELDALIAQKVMGEPKPVYVDDWDRVFANTLNGTPIKSPRGAWVEKCLYEHGDNQEWIPLPFSTDIAVAFSVEDEIARCGLQEKYAYELKKLVSGMSDSTFMIRDRRGWYDDVEFRFVHATPEQRCRAALRAVGVDAPV